MDSNSTKKLPLCVDLDGTLVATDTLVELCLVLLKQHPTRLFSMFSWLMHGKAHFKTQVAAHAHISAEHLPYHEELLSYLRQQKETGRELYLVTASARTVAQQVAQHVGLFVDVIGSNRANNYAGKHKAAALTERFGTKGFAYIGNAWIDVPVWAAAGAAGVVSNNQALRAAAEKVAPVEKFFMAPSMKASVWLRALRVKQWIKNILLFVPLIAAHEVTQTPQLTAAILGFVAFVLASSSVYILNDLLDLEADRRHPIKRFRPFAAGELPLFWGILAVPLLVIASVLIASLLPNRFIVLLLLYLGLTLAYSLRLKRVVLVDVILLSLLYTIRIFAGAAAIVVPMSSWLTAFAMFFFLSFATIKRFIELERLKNSTTTRAHGRGYTVTDREVISQIGVGSGLISAVILALYISSPEIHALYRTPKLLWLMIPLLVFWISRGWVLAHRGELHEDPTTFIIRDKTSYIVAGVVLLIVLAATVVTL